MKPSPCKECPKKGCGAYHSKCKFYNDWKGEIEESKTATQEDFIIPPHQIKKHWRSMRYNNRFNRKA